MDTVTGQPTTSDERILLELETRSIEESDAIAARAQTEPQLPARATGVRLWAEADADAIAQLSNASLQTALDVIARNMLTSSTYAEQFNVFSPQHAMAVQPVAHAQQVVHVIATHLALKPDMLLDRAANWPEHVADYFRAPGQHQDVQQHVERMLNGISQDSVKAFQAQAASMLAPSSAGSDKLRATSGLRIRTAWEMTYEEQVHQIARVVSENANLVPWKIDANLRREPASVRALLADSGLMKELDGAIKLRLAHILPNRLAAAQATIAVTLNRPDTDQRMQVAQALRAEQSSIEKPQTPTTTSAAAETTELQALRERFRQHITSTSPTKGDQLGMKDLYERIADRHRLYDDIAIAARMKQGLEVLGSAKPHAVRSVVPSGQAAQWAKLDAADLQSMLRAVGDRLEYLVPIQSAINLINGTSERNRVYRSNFNRMAPTIRADVETNRLLSESHAVAEFIRVNHTQPAWKIQSNLDRAQPALQRIITNSKRMEELDAAIQEQLPALGSHQIRAVQAVIAGDLQQADIIGEPASPPPAPGQSPVPRTEQDHAKAEPPDAPLHQATTLQASKGTASDEKSAAQSTHNGIIPVSGVQADHAPVVKKLLEDMSYKIRIDGSVLYQVQGKDAFIDHGDQLLMVKGAEKEERAILSALLLAKEKYGGAFELTGSEAFKRAAIDVLVKYQLDVRLKNPEQDLLRREAGKKQAQKEFAKASPEHPAAPVDLAALGSRVTTTMPSPNAASIDTPQAHLTPPDDQRTVRPAPEGSMGTSVQRPDEPVDTTAQAPRAATVPDPPNTDSIGIAAQMERPEDYAPSETTPVDRLTGTLVSHGKAPYQNTLRNDVSYFVELKNSDGHVRTHWGQGLATALKVSDARIGDEIALKRLETVDITKKVPRWDEHGNFLEQHTISGHRNQWEAQILQRQPDSHAAALTDQESEQAPQAEHLTGMLLRHGIAPYLNNMRNGISYFVNLIDHDGQMHTQWGKQLAGALQAAEAQIGDKVSLKWLGTNDVTEHNPGAEGEKDAGHERTVSAQPNAWEAQILQRRPHSRAANHAKSDAAQPVSSSVDTMSNLLCGRLLEHGAALLKNARDGKPSYFVQIQNPDGTSRTFWGLDLKRALVKSGAQKGDDIVLQNLGRKPMQVEAPTRDSVGNVIGMGTVISHRNAWEISTSRPVTRQSEAVSVAEASPTPQADRVAVREAAWWQRQVLFISTCIEQVPALQGRLAELGPRPDSRDVAWLDKHGARHVVSNDTSYGAICDRMPSLKDCQQPVLALEGGTLDGNSKSTALKLIRASDNYLQGIAQVDGKVRHVVALLPSASGGVGRNENAPIPLMAAIPASDGFTWERIGQLRTDNSVPAPGDNRQAATINFDIGRESIRVQVHVQPGEALHQRLGFAAASDLQPNNNDLIAPRQPAHSNHMAHTIDRPAKSDTPTYT
ncbi:LPD7 domain-containing protein [Massilia sp. NR 4-1]|uniref:LPD7 domain-containing protein n=1 Tax=Massilia sp. NR 4-1 TaxID=1678028 RepID=UPI00067DE25F|nr:LPD7 domain-containing protein [Massilia sp. NR 4-1]AKU21223.1 hypothetical protein ACZ75_06755 [Massilia sp. NR 4-1]